MGFLNIILNEMSLRYCFYMSVNKAEKAYGASFAGIKEENEANYYVHI